MAMEWFQRAGKDTKSIDDTQGEFKPEQFKSELETSHKAQIDSLKADFDAKLAPLSEMAEYFKEQRAAQARAATAAAAVKHTEDNAVDDDLWITNPGEAARRVNEPVIRQAQATAAITMRREVLSEKPYYYGDFKIKVDSMIEQQPLAARANAQVLENCYKVVLADHVQDITEGKLKAQTFGASFTGSGTGASKGSTEEKNEELSSEEKYMASKFGMDEKAWHESKRELNYV